MRCVHCISEGSVSHTNGLEGVGGGEPYSEPSQQVEEAEAEVTGESFTNHDRYIVWRSHTQRVGLRQKVWP